MFNCQTTQLPPYQQKKSFKYFLLKKKVKEGPFAWFGAKTINGVWSLSSIA